MLDHNLFSGSTQTLLMEITDYIFAILWEYKASWVCFDSLCLFFYSTSLLKSQISLAFSSNRFQIAHGVRMQLKREESTGQNGLRLLLATVNSARHGWHFQRYVCMHVNHQALKASVPVTRIKSQDNLDVSESQLSWNKHSKAIFIMSTETSNAQRKGHASSEECNPFSEY